MFLAAATILLLLTLTGLYFARVVTLPETFSLEEIYDSEREKGKFDEQALQSWAQEEVTFHSPYGYVLSGLFFPVAGSARTVILTHGITCNRNCSLKYMALFRDLGFNILIYDLRFHGLSGGRYAAFGYYEKDDLKTITDWAVERAGPNAVIGTHGESMGAAISLLHAAIDPRVAFVIADSSFSDLMRLLAHRIRIDYRIPGFPILQTASLMSRMLSGMSFRSVSPERVMASITVPVLIAHGAKDSFIPVSMAQELYDHKANGPRQLYFTPDAEHAETFWSDPAAYKAAVQEFLQRNRILQTS